MLKLLVVLCVVVVELVSGGESSESLSEPSARIADSIAEVVSNLLNEVALLDDNDLFEDVKKKTRTNLAAAGLFDDVTEKLDDDVTDKLDDCLDVLNKLVEKENEAEPRPTFTRLLDLELTDSQRNVLSSVSKHMAEFGSAMHSMLGHDSATRASTYITITPDDEIGLVSYENPLPQVGPSRPKPNPSGV